MFTFPLSCSTLYQFVFTTDFTWASSGGIHTNWFRSTSSTTSSVTFGDAQRRRIIILCKQQWGYVEIGSVDATKTITFPISYTTIYGAVIGEINIYEQDACGLRIMSISKSELKIFGWDNVSGYWLVIGIQQWGYVANLNTDSSATITLPISISTLLVPIGASATKNSNPRYTNCVQFTLASSSTLTIDHSGSSVSYYWFIIAKQQWGVNTSSNGATISFPITFPNTVYTLVVTSNRRTTSTCANQGYVDNTSSFICYTDMTNGKGYWISAGKQQWGEAYGYKTSKITTLPIAFPNQKLCEVVGVTYTSEFYQSPACIKRGDGSLTTITTGVYSGSTSTTTPVRYIILGIQQWGVKTNSSNAENLQITYPISFTNAYSSVGSRTANGATSYWPFVIDSSDFTNTGFQAHTAGNVYWHAIGI